MSRNSDLSPAQRLSARELAERFAAKSMAPEASWEHLQPQYEDAISFATNNLDEATRDAFVEAVSEEFRMLRAEAKKNRGALERRLAPQVQRSNNHRCHGIVEEIGRVAIRATVWESIRALFRWAR